MTEDIISKITRIDYNTATQKITDFLRDELVQTESDGFVLGLSGGIDSAVVAHICARVDRDRTLAMIMPDSDVSSKGETEDALRIVKDTQIQYKLLDIGPIFKEYSRYIEPNFKALGNLRARIRANILYYYANAYGKIVVGTSDKSEYLIGYFTKFGDSSADVMPIISLYKLQVRGIARYLGIPDSIITKKSGAHLWKDHFAEDEIKAVYEDIDRILYCMSDKNMSIEQTVHTTGIKRDIVETVWRLNQNTAHKRNSARMIEIS